MTVQSPYIEQDIVWAETVPVRRAWAPRAGVVAGMVYAMFLCLLFLLQLGSKGAAAAIALAAVLAAVERRNLTRLFDGRALLFLIPLVCIATALWSDAPGASLRYGAEMFLTVAAGLVLSLTSRPREAIIGAFAAFATYAAISLVFGHYSSAGTIWAAFTGLDSGKNFLAEIAATGALLAIAVPFFLLESWRPMVLLAALAAAPALALEFYILVVARSAGAILALASGVGLLALLLTVSRLPSSWRIGVSVIGAFLLGLVGLFHDQIASTASQAALEAFHKDPTLTGRTYLWYRAHQMIAERPLLGHGFYAFWRHGNPDAEGLWQFADIDGRSGFNFHNTGIESLMQFGWVGSLTIAAVVAVTAVALARRFVLHPSVALCLWLALCGFELVRSFFESIGPMPFYFSNVMLAAALGFAFRPVGMDESETAR